VNAASVECRLREIADAVKSCVREPDAEMQYDVMSDALIWTDEYPEPSADVGFSKLSVLRLLLRYRTTVLLGNPDPSLSEYWEVGKQLFPTWPAFAQERCSPRREFTQYFETHSRTNL